MEKSPEAFRTISEVADWLGVPTHVLRFWESRFNQIKPVKRAGGRRYYRPTDMALIGGIKRLLHDEGMTIRGAQKLLREKGVRHVASLSQPLDGGAGMEEIIEASVVDAAPAPETASPGGEAAPAPADTAIAQPTVEDVASAEAAQQSAPETPPAPADAGAFGDLPEISTADPEDDDEAFPAAPGIAARLRLADRAHLARRAADLRSVRARIAGGSAA